MTAPTLTSALAVPFAWTSAGNDVVLAFASGTSPVNVTIPTGTYRMVLAPAATDIYPVRGRATKNECVLVVHAICRQGDCLVV